MKRLVSILCLLAVLFACNSNKPQPQSATGVAGATDSGAGGSTSAGAAGNAGAAGI